MDAAEVAALSRRDRLRAATSQEIIATARRLLIEEGIAAVSLRAIARKMGMTAPALYRYFGSHEDLIEHLVAGIFTELSAHVEAAIGATQADDPSAAGAGTAGALITACQAFRDWAVANPAEFSMIFGSPLPGVELRHDDPLAEYGLNFAAIYLRLLTALWLVKPFAVPDDDAIEPSLRAQLASYRDQLGSTLPLGVLQAFLRCWVLLYGMVSLEVFGHLRFALEDSRGMFELMLTDLASVIGLQYPMPG